MPSIDFDTEGMPDIPAFDQTRPIEPPKVHYNSDFNPFKTSSASSYSGGGSYSRPKVDWEGLYDGLEKASKMNTPMEEEPFVDETDWASAPASVDMSEERTPYVQETGTVSSPSASIVYQRTGKWRRCAAFSIQRALYSDFGKIRFDADRPAPGAYPGAV